MRAIFKADILRAKTAWPQMWQQISWAKVATNLFHFENEDFLVTIDYFSDFFDLERVYSTTLETAVTKLKGHFARFSAPYESVSDNGPQLVAERVRNFAQVWWLQAYEYQPSLPLVQWEGWISSKGSRENHANVKSERQWFLFGLPECLEYTTGSAQYKPSPNYDEQENKDNSSSLRKPTHAPSGTKYNEKASSENNPGSRSTTIEEQGIQSSSKKSKGWNFNYSFSERETGQTGK